jgi:hypothetical protein
MESNESIVCESVLWIRDLKNLLLLFFLGLYRLRGAALIFFYQFTRALSLKEAHRGPPASTVELCLYSKGTARLFLNFALRGSTGTGCCLFCESCRECQIILYGKTIEPIWCVGPSAEGWRKSSSILITVSFCKVKLLDKSYVLL